MPNLKNKQSGQALLVVLMVIAVVVIVAASAISRSVSDVSITSREVDSQRAFSAAEAGVESALLVGNTQATLPNQEASYNATVATFAGNSNQYVHPSELSNGDTATIWFVSKDVNGNPTCSGQPCFSGQRLSICWGRQKTYNNPQTIPAAEITMFYARPAFAYSNLQRSTIAADPNAARRVTNSYKDIDSGNCTLNGQGFAFKKTIALGNSGSLDSFGITPPISNGVPIFARVTLRYNTDEPYSLGIDVNGQGTLPAQGDKITSSGSSNNATRKVEVYNLYPDHPPIFDSSIFTEGSISK